MTFIPKNPLTMPEIENTPSTPCGTRGIFAKKDGWYDIDSDGIIKKIAYADSGGQTEITLDTEMSDTSENGVQNKVIKKYVDSIPNIKLWEQGKEYKKGDIVYYSYDNLGEEGGDELLVCLIDHNSSNPDGDYEFYGGLWDRFAYVTVEYARQSNYSYYSEYASFDGGGYPLKGCAVDEFDEDDNALGLYLCDASIVSFGILESGIIVFLEDYCKYVGFNSGLYFTTPSVIPENYSQFPADIYFKGDSTDEGAFIPEPDTRYTMVFDYDGNLMIGYVNGVPAPPVSEVTE